MKPASGKNTLGELLIGDFNKDKYKAILLDLDSYIEKYCPTWIWKDDQSKEKDLQTARVDYINEINDYLRQDYIVVAIGERFLSYADVQKYLKWLIQGCPIYLYHLSAPIELRRKRLHDRGPHSLIDLEKDQKDRDAIKELPGYVYPNINFPHEDAISLLKLIKADIGRI